MGATAQEHRGKRGEEAGVRGKTRSAAGEAKKNCLVAFFKKNLPSVEIKASFLNNNKRENIYIRGSSGDWAEDKP